MLDIFVLICLQFYCKSVHLLFPHSVYVYTITIYVYIYENLASVIILHFNKNFYIQNCS